MRRLVLGVVLVAIATSALIGAALATAAQLGTERPVGKSASAKVGEASAAKCTEAGTSEGAEAGAGEAGAEAATEAEEEAAECAAREAKEEKGEAGSGGGAEAGTEGEPGSGGGEAGKGAGINGGEVGTKASTSSEATTQSGSEEEATSTGSESTKGEKHSSDKKVHRGSELSESEAQADKSNEEEPDRKRRRADEASKAKRESGEAEESAAAAETEAASEEEDSGALSSLDLGDGASTLEELEVPTALLPVYQACGTRYGISWEVLAAINKVETGFGTDLGTSGAGAEGWMQFLPQSWKEWGVDADGDGTADPDDPVDAICSAARYLAASGGESDIYDAVLAYNHADWYAREVLADARRYERVAANLVDSLTELAAGSTFPVAGNATFWNAAQAEESLSSEWASEATISSDEDEEGTEAEAAEGAEAEEAEGETKSATIDAEAGAKVQAVVDGTVAKAGESEALGRYVVLRDAYGDRFVYSGLGKVTVGPGATVTEGEELGEAGESGIDFSIRPDASTTVDPTELLELWKHGGVGKVYGVDAEGASADSKPVRALLMSTSTLRREVLADEDLELPTCVRKAVGADELGRQSLAALEYLTARGYKIGVAAGTCEHADGFTVEIDSVDGKSVEGAQGSGTAARELAQTVVAMDASTAPRTVASTTGIAAAETGGTSSQAIELDYEPPQKARIVDGDAVAPTDAPAAVQAMIAAANQIDTTPYVWGGGHGSFVSDGYDCSGSVSYVLHAAKMLAAPETSGALEGWGESGTGNWVTVYANAEHTYAVIAGLRWDTVGDATGSGPRWHTGAAYPAGFTVRHPAGL
ncbi:MAG TPA: lytic murein transglycosylase [Solirubrobacterales bacterium]|nr:lytic murein transglycosylase [Solirubrobacterales bacterium]